MSNVLDAIMNQYEGSKTTTKDFGEQDFSKYFTPRLEDDEKSGEVTIRIMPPSEEGKSPFEEAHWHVMKVNGKWRKLYCRQHNDGETCPLCEVEAALRKTGSSEDKELAKTYKARKFYVARVIDRGNEGDGVKFWRFPHNWKGEGILDKLIPIFTKRSDITHPREGRDITLFMNRSKEGYTKVTSIMAEDADILTSDKKKAKEWMADDTTYKGLYKAQPLDYLEIIANGEVPVWDKGLEKFVVKIDDSVSEAEIEEKLNDTFVEKSNDTTTDDDDDELPF